jgi:hypothetical protein
MVGGPVGRGVGPEGRERLVGGPSCGGVGIRSGKGLPSGNGAELMVSGLEESAGVLERRRAGSCPGFKKEGCRGDAERGERMPLGALDVDPFGELVLSGSSRRRIVDLNISNGSCLPGHTCCID